LAEAILAKIDLATFKGPKGDKGDAGDAGTTPAIDLDALAQAVVERLPPQRVEWERLDGTVLYQNKPLGEPLKFKSIEIEVSK
jgi:hypothetical protein